MDRFKKRIARVFPRRTPQTPDDPLAFVGPPPRLLPIECDEVRISVTFDWDVEYSKNFLLPEWELLGKPVLYGGPAFGDRGEEFVPGLYLKEGVTITSRGCPNRCWFCRVWTRDPKPRELPIVPGRIVQDDNLLACSYAHVSAVFDMLKTQRKVEFLGGLEPARLKPWHVERIAELSLEQLFLAYDTPEDEEPFVYVARMLREAGFTKRYLRAYVLCGYLNDTISKAEGRMLTCLKEGVYPFPMPYQDKEEGTPDGWSDFVRFWSRPALVYNKYKNILGGDDGTEDLYLQEEALLGM